MQDFFNVKVMAANFDIITSQKGHTRDDKQEEIDDAKMSRKDRGISEDD